MTLGGVDPGDSRNRPVVLRTESPADSPRRRHPRPRTLLGMSAVALLTAAGVVAGSWSVWAVVGTTAPSGNPAPPLWFSPPAPEITTTVDSLLPLSTEDNPNKTLEREDHPQRGGSSTGTPAPTTESSSSEPQRGGEEEEHGGSGRGGRG